MVACKMEKQCLLFALNKNLNYTTFSNMSAVLDTVRVSWTLAIVHCNHADRHHPDFDLVRRDDACEGTVKVGDVDTVTFLYREPIEGNTLQNDT